MLLQNRVSFPQANPPPRSRQTSNEHHETFTRRRRVSRVKEYIYIPIHLRRSGSRTQPRRESDYVYNILPRAMLIRAARSPLVIDYYAVGCRAARQLIYEPRGWREGRERRWSRNLTWNSDGLVTPANTHDRDFFFLRDAMLIGSHVCKV